MPISMPSNAPVAPVPPNNQSYQPRNYFNDFNPGIRNLHGYFIKDENEIVPKYIPMDGSISFFPYQNLSKIVIKQWDSNGLQTLTYIPAPPANASGQNGNDVQTPDGQGGDQLPLSPQVPPRPDPVMATLENINNGLATTFTQVGTTLQAIQQEVNQLNAMLTNAVNEGLGGRG